MTPSARWREFSDWRPWLTGALVIAFAALAGLTIVGLTWPCSQLSDGDVS